MCPLGVTQKNTAEGKSLCAMTLREREMRNASLVFRTLVASVVKVSPAWDAAPLSVASSPRQVACLLESQSLIWKRGPYGDLQEYMPCAWSRGGQSTCHSGHSAPATFTSGTYQDVQQSRTGVCGAHCLRARSGRQDRLQGLWADPLTACWSSGNWPRVLVLMRAEAVGLPLSWAWIASSKRRGNIPGDMFFFIKNTNRRTRN